MENSKVMAVVCWIISAIAFLSAALICERNLSKNVIFMLGMGVAWFIIGIIYWKKRVKHG